jgi:hypothetical protein
MIVRKPRLLRINPSPVLRRLDGASPVSTLKAANELLLFDRTSVSRGPRLLAGELDRANFTEVISP